MQRHWPPPPGLHTGTSTTSTKPSPTPFVSTRTWPRSSSPCKLCTSSTQGQSCKLLAGRVVSVAAYGDSLQATIDAAYREVNAVRFQGMHERMLLDGNGHRSIQTSPHRASHETVVQVSKAHMASRITLNVCSHSSTQNSISRLQKSLPFFTRTPQSALVVLSNHGLRERTTVQPDPAFSRLCDPASSMAKSKPRGSRANGLQTAESFLIRAVQLKIHNLCRAASPMLSELRRRKADVMTILPLNVCSLLSHMSLSVERPLSSSDQRTEKSTFVYVCTAIT